MPYTKINHPCNSSFCSFCFFRSCCSFSAIGNNSIRCALFVPDPTVHLSPFLRDHSYLFCRIFPCTLRNPDSDGSFSASTRTIQDFPSSSLSSFPDLPHKFRQAESHAWLCPGGDHCCHRWENSCDSPLLLLLFHLPTGPDRSAPEAPLYLRHTHFSNTSYRAFHFSSYIFHKAECTNCKNTFKGTR